MVTPAADSFCPLENIRGHELFLWHDFRYNPGHPDKDERGLRVDEGTWNRWLEGLPTLIGVPKTDGSRADFVYKEDAAFIFTGPFEFTAYKNGRPNLRETEQLTTRVRYVYFNKPAAAGHGGRALEPCPGCWSQWVLRGEVAWQTREGKEPDAFMQEVKRQPFIIDEAPHVAADAAPPSPATTHAAASICSQDDVYTRLANLMEWKQRGWLSDTEFQTAKALLLQAPRP